MKLLCDHKGISAPRNLYPINGSVYSPEQTRYQSCRDCGREWIWEDAKSPVVGVKTTLIAIGVIIGAWAIIALAFGLAYVVLRAF